MALSKEETLAYMTELEEKNKDLRGQLNDRPTVAVQTVVEVTIESSWQSDTLGALALALSKAQNEFESIDKSTEAYNYKYATLNDTLKMVRPILFKNKLSISQLNVSKVQGKTLFTGVKTILMHESGEWLASESYLPTSATKSNNIAQVQGSYQSYNRRYGLMSILNLSTEDKDGAA